MKSESFFTREKIIAINKAMRQRYNPETKCFSPAITATGVPVQVQISREEIIAAWTKAVQAVTSSQA